MQLITGPGMFRAQISVALAPVFFPLYHAGGGATSSDKSMTAPFFVVWVGVNQVWQKHTWEATCSVWGTRETVTYDVPSGLGL